jgi:hypothetical protein
MMVGCWISWGVEVMSRDEEKRIAFGRTTKAKANADSLRE